MIKQTFTFIDEQGKEIFVYKWFPEDKPKGIVQIAHGMVETASRYERLAEMLTTNGYGVYAHDQRGHGKTAKMVENIGHLSKNEFDFMEEDIYEITKIIKKENPGLKIFLLAHSMGSFVAQKYIADYGNEIDGVALSGTAGKQKMTDFGIILSSIGKLIMGEKSKSNLIDKMTFGPYNKKFAPNRTKFDWITRDESEVDKYIANPFCGIVCTYGFFNNLFKGLKKIHSEEIMRKIPKDLPVFFIAGTCDPVGENTKSISWLISKYIELGIKDVSHKFYEGGRHEMFNEINRDEVTTDLISWLNSHM